MNTLKGVLMLTRPHNLFVAIITTFIGYGLVSRIYGLPLLSSSFIYATAVVVFVAAAGYVINDYYDVETDRVSKPWRPLVTGIVAPTTARLLAYILYLAGMVVSLVLGFWPAVFAALNAVLTHEYSRWVKKTGFLGNLLVALNSAATILFGGLVRSLDANSPVPYLVLLPSLYAFLLILGREIVKGIEDVEGDKRIGAMTLAVSCGVHCARSVAALLLLVVVAISPLPALLGPYNLAYLALALVVDASIILAIHALYNGHEARHIVEASRRARSLLKISLLAGGLAFALGLF
ncbi:hypothetical protein CF15_02850 [Pyrodictium occultum]|uniref:Digeranylgeranylglyceryl phosphate synthase n=1 Tax=Pyrodictium occultum TaxID=2309 RepID=A0A0V8RUQ8_PYROC|nr:hypothetical protein CF15_02850 [Pyrodictium occultum]